MYQAAPQHKQATYLPIDLRSDTVTKPTAAMLKAMQEAPLGDDVYGEDPTVNRLQAIAAELSGHEAALFMPTGTMSNQAAIATHTTRGVEVIAPEGAHIYEYEPGALAVISGALPRLIPSVLGAPAAEDVRAAIKNNPHQAPTGLVVLENTHNRAGGTVVGLKDCQDIAQIAHQHNLPIHLDGARVCNAVTALKIELSEMCKVFDSVSICLSKALAAPVGTVLVGSKEFIAKTHRYRKMLGGGMRQAGVLAAAGIIALTEMRQRLQEDHDRAKDLAEGLVKIEGLSLDMSSVQSNMVYFNVTKADTFAKLLGNKGLFCNAVSSNRIRLVTHYQIADEDVSRALGIIAETAEVHQKSLTKAMQHA
ncbi:MAG: GntG family PLP-dependent aldolase [Deinococcales bacterium]